MWFAKCRTDDDDDDDQMKPTLVNKEMINCIRNDINFGNILHVGSYTDTTGLRIVREHVAQFITKGDGYTADPDSIFLTSGGATAIKVGNL